MNQADLVSEISKAADLSLEDSEKVFMAFARVIREELKEGEMVQIVRLEALGDLERLEQ